jgi:2-dehydro-3-deoxyphosphooctonate aldolase (KDO 8-P synthase)
MSKASRNRIVTVGSVPIGPGCPLALIAGPCVIESHEHTLRMAEGIKAISDRLGMPLIFEASFAGLHFTVNRLHEK